jgi:methylenetetrahydrofolate dehydrogenase (NADP+)/methenyltetrahydrofolate cyclohydrolase
MYLKCERLKMAIVINGNGISENINEKVQQGISGLKGKTPGAPSLVSLIVKGNRDAELYVSMQKRVAESLGITFRKIELDKDIQESEVKETLFGLNRDKEVTSIIVQKPLPPGIDHSSVVSCISPEKDAEGIHPFNLGKIMKGEASIVPCTPGAVMKILKQSGVHLFGTETVVIGHSSIVGKPLSVMLLNEMATVTVCHLGTSQKGDIKAHTRRADLLIVAAGVPSLVEEDWVKEGVKVIDVGINKTREGIRGDVDYARVEKKASLITPVPGGVGPVTVSILMRNVLRAYMAQHAMN